ncbi:MAG: hypothetical protein WAW46_06465, partial [Polaromonas sp.]
MQPAMALVCQPVNHFFHRLAAGLELPAMQTYHLYASPQSFAGGIAQTSVFVRHRDFHLLALENIPELMSAVLATAVRVNDGKCRQAGCCSMPALALHGAAVQ